MRRPRLFRILPKLLTVLLVNLYPLVGSQVVATLVPFPVGNACAEVNGVMHSVSSARKMSVWAGLVVVTLIWVGYAWVEMVKSPVRKRIFFVSVMLKFLKNETSKLRRPGVLM